MELCCLHIVLAHKGQPNDVVTACGPRIDSSIDVEERRIRPYLPYDGENLNAQSAVVTHKVRNTVWGKVKKSEVQQALD